MQGEACRPIATGLGTPAAEALEQGACVGRQLGPEVRHDGEAVLLVGPLGTWERIPDIPSASVYTCLTDHMVVRAACDGKIIWHCDLQAGRECHWSGVLRACSGCAQGSCTIAATAWGCRARHSTLTFAGQHTGSEAAEQAYGNRHKAEHVECTPHPVCCQAPSSPAYPCPVQRHSIWPAPARPAARRRQPPPPLQRRCLVRQALPPQRQQEPLPPVAAAARRWKQEAAAAGMVAAWRCRAVAAAHNAAIVTSGCVALSVHSMWMVSTPSTQTARLCVPPCHPAGHHGSGS